MTSRIKTNLERVEDLAAEAIAAGRRAAAGLATLPADLTRRTPAYDWMARNLRAGRLLDPNALDALAGLEQRLHTAVEAEAWYTLDDYDECDTCYYTHAPERRLTPEGQRIEHVRDDLAAAIGGAHRALDLLQAERAVGRIRGFLS